MKIVELRQLNQCYRDREIFKELKLDIYQGEFISLMGRSGSGKSTLLNILGLLERPTAGAYFFKEGAINYQDQRALAQRRRDEIGFVFQNYGLIAEKNVQANIELPLVCQKIAKKARQERVMAITEKLGINDLLKKMPRHLSGGEAQRVSIARALIKEPAIILADEPTGALDEEREAEIMAVFKAVNQTGVTVVIATHNKEIANICHRNYVIENHQIIEK